MMWKLVVIFPEHNLVVNLILIQTENICIFKRLEAFKIHIFFQMSGQLCMSGFNYRKFDIHSSKFTSQKTYPSLFRMILSNKFSIGWLASYDSIYRVKKTVRAAVKSSILQLQQKQIMWKAHSQIITFGLNRVLRWPIKEKKSNYHYYSNWIMHYWLAVSST